MKSIREALDERMQHRYISERAELLQFFHERLRDKNGKPYRIAYLGMRLAPIKNIDDLYYLKSICIDAENRGKGFGKTFWGSIKSKNK